MRSRPKRPIIFEIFQSDSQLPSSVRLAQFVVTCIVPLALWILLSGLDDLWISLVFLFTRRKPFPWPAASKIDFNHERRIAILVPLWREHRVIGQMLEHNLAAIRYSAYDVFVGVYPNDEDVIGGIANGCE